MTARPVHATLTGVQSAESRAILVTRHRALVWGRGPAVSTLYRRLPHTGAPDLVAPLYRHVALWCSEQDAARQHQTLWRALQKDALGPAIMRALPAREDPLPGTPPDSSLTALKPTNITLN